jgi:hypothetical protein
MRLQRAPLRSSQLVASKPGYTLTLRRQDVVRGYPTIQISLTERQVKRQGAKVPDNERCTTDAMDEALPSDTYMSRM